MIDCLLVAVVNSVFLEKAFLMAENNAMSDQFAIQTPDWLNRIGLLLLCLMPLMIFLGIGVCDASITLIGVLFLVRSILTKDWSWLRQGWIIVALMLWAYLLLISPFAVASPKASFHQALPFGRFIIFAAALQVWLLAQEKNHHYLLTSLTWTLVFIAVNALFSFMTGLTLLGQNALQVGHGFVWVWDRPYTRLMGINHKLNAGILMSWMAMPVVAHIFSKIKIGFLNRQVVLAAGFYLLMILAIIVTGERIAMLEFFMGSILLFLFMPSARRYLLLSGVIGLALMGLLFLANQGIYHRQVGLVISTTDHIKHTPYGGILMTAWMIFKSHLWFGIGLKQYGFVSALPQYAALQGSNTHAQNIYLEFLSGTGVIGTLLLLSMMGCWVRSFWRGRHLIIVTPVIAGIFIAWFQRIWPLASTTSIFFSWGGVTFWWMAAWCMARLRHAKDV